MKRFVIVKTPSEGYMRKQKMFFTGIEKTDPKSVCKNTICYNAICRKAKMFETKKKAEDQLKKIVQMLGDDVSLYRVEEVCE